MQNLIFKLPMRDASDNAVLMVSYGTGENLIRNLFPRLVPHHGDNGHERDPDCQVPDALIIEAVADDGRTVTIEVPFSDADRARVTIA